MGAHDFTLPGKERWQISAEKSALPFLECFPWSSTICRKVIDEEAAGRAFTVHAHHVERAAALLFTLVQDGLMWMREFGYGAPAQESLLALWGVQDLAAQAVTAVCPGARRTAKVLQIKAAGPDKPLTVCVGDLRPTRFQT